MLLLIDVNVDSSQNSSFTNWGVGEPRSISGSEDCAQIVNGVDSRPGAWVMEDCLTLRRYICMKDAGQCTNQ